MGTISATIIGNLTRDPVIRHTKDGKRVAEVGLAVNYSKDHVIFTKVTVFENNAYLAFVIDDLAKAKKGQLFVGVGFQYHVDEWVDGQGEERETHHFKPGFGATVLIRPSLVGSESETGNDPQEDDHSGEGFGSVDDKRYSDDDLPF